MKKLFYLLIGNGLPRFARNAGFAVACLFIICPLSFAALKSDVKDPVLREIINEMNKKYKEHEKTWAEQIFKRVIRV